MRGLPLGLAALAAAPFVLPPYATTLLTEAIDRKRLIQQKHDARE